MSQRRTTVRPSAEVDAQRPRRPAARRVLLASLLAGAVLLTAAPSVAAAPRPPNPTDEQIGGARSAKDAAAAEVGRISGLVATAEAELQRLSYLAEAAGTAYLAAEEALGEAQAAAEKTAARLRAAAAEVAAAQRRI